MFQHFDIFLHFFNTTCIKSIPKFGQAVSTYQIFADEVNIPFGYRIIFERVVTKETFMKHLSIPPFCANVANQTRMEHAH